MLGIDGYVVRVEADSAPGTPGFTIIGLPDRALGLRVKNASLRITSPRQSAIVRSNDADSQRKRLA
jgi:predicted ATPase with chaperone activity